MKTISSAVVLLACMFGAGVLLGEADAQAKKPVKSKVEPEPVKKAVPLMEATATDKRVVILYEDGTWAFKPAPPEPEIETAPVSGRTFGGKLTSNFDEFTNKTNVKWEGSTLTPNTGSAKQNSGITPVAVTMLGIKGSGIALLQFRQINKEWSYLKCHHTALLVDAVPMPLETTHDGTVGSGYVLERVSTPLDQKEVITLAKASVIKVKICNDVFLLEDIDGFILFAKEMGWFK